MKPLLAFVGLLIVIALVIMSGYNGLVSTQEAVNTQWAQVQNVYQRRADLIPNLVKTVEGAANFEKGTLTEITEARASVGKVQLNNAPTDPAQLEQFEKAQGALSGALGRLMVIVERYPDLKANTGFLALQSQLEGTENRISVERGRFNEVVQTYNTKIKSIPAVFYAAALGFKERPYFQAKEGAEEPPKVDFNFGGAKPAQP
jgi:LemA protein